MKFCRWLRSHWQLMAAGEESQFSLGIRPLRGLLKLQYTVLHPCTLSRLGGSFKKERTELGRNEGHRGEIKRGKKGKWILSKHYLSKQHVCNSQTIKKENISKYLQQGQDVAQWQNVCLTCTKILSSIPYPEFFSEIYSSYQWYGFK